MVELNASTRNRRSWIPVAGVLLAAGWGSQQFTPMLLVYQGRLHLSTSTLEALFGAYAAGLIPGLLAAAWWSDRNGRRPVSVWGAALSLIASASLAASTHALALMFIGRLLAGVASGAAFGAGTAWLRELSVAPFGDATLPAAGRRAAVTMTLGFGVGPLVTGALAQWGPDPAVVAYIPHIVCTALVLLALRVVPETLASPDRPGVRSLVADVAAPRFRRVVAPMAPWVFAAPAIAIALLPTIVGAGHAADGIALTAAVTSIMAFAGVLVQPLARRLQQRSAPPSAASIGLLVIAAGVAVAAVTVDVRQTWLLIPSAVVLGAGYGVCLIAGLHEVQELAAPGASAGLTSVFYTLAYLGFASPYLFALASGLASYTVLLAVACAIALLTAARVHRATAGARPARASYRAVPSSLRHTASR